MILVFWIDWIGEHLAQLRDIDGAQHFVPPALVPDGAAPGDRVEIVVIAEHGRD